MKFYERCCWFFTPRHCEMASTILGPVYTYTAWLSPYYVSCVAHLLVNSILRTFSKTLLRWGRMGIVISIVSEWKVRIVHCYVMRHALKILKLSKRPSRKQSNISKPISGITIPKLGMFVLIWMHFSWWIQIR